MIPEKIERFEGRYDFLSNFYPASLTIDGYSFLIQKLRIKHLSVRMLTTMRRSLNLMETRQSGLAV